jgi:hypothetical protein
MERFDYLVRNPGHAGHWFRIDGGQYSGVMADGVPGRCRTILVA